MGNYPYNLGSIREYGICVEGGGCELGLWDIYGALEQLNHPCDIIVTSPTLIQVVVDYMLGVFSEWGESEYKDRISYVAGEIDGKKAEFLQAKLPLPYIHWVAFIGSYKEVKGGEIFIVSKGNKDSEQVYMKEFRA